MSIHSLALSVAVAALFGCSAPLNHQPQDAPLVIIDGQEISSEHYKEFIYTSVASSELARMVDTVLIQQAADKFGITISADRLNEHVDLAWTDLRGGMSEDAFQAQYRKLGFDKQATLKALRASATTQLQLEDYVVATRVITDEKLQRAFTAQYGHAGIEVEVAHIMIIAHYIHAAALRDNNEISFERAQELALKEAKACLEKLSAGANFSEMVAEYSNDTSSNLNQGLLSTYRPGMYGEAFEKTVNRLNPQQTSETLVESGAGLHIVRLNSRVVTALDDVREQLSRELLIATPGLSEIKQAIIDLRSAAKIEYRDLD
ncbi:MAG: parvulin-like peptidyl-prolyl isomerase [Myxococcota bacterium]|jgi:parvulin-like peptidyl-prolyl isomerase